MVVVILVVVIVKQRVVDRGAKRTVVGSTRKAAAGRRGGNTAGLDRERPGDDYRPPLPVVASVRERHESGRWQNRGGARASLSSPQEGHSPDKGRGLHEAVVARRRVVRVEERPQSQAGWAEEGRGDTLSCKEPHG